MYRLFIYGLGIADQFIRAGTYRTILVIGAETLSRITDYTDRNTCVLFGDRAGAAVLRAGEEPGLLGLEIGADGRGGELLVLPAGGSRNPASRETVAARRHYIHMAGREVFKFAVKIMEESALRVLARAGLQPGEVDSDHPAPGQCPHHRFGLQAPGHRAGQGLRQPGPLRQHVGGFHPRGSIRGQRPGQAQTRGLRPVGGLWRGLTWGAAVIKWNKEAKHD